VILFLWGPGTGFGCSVCTEVYKNATYLVFEDNVIELSICWQAERGFCSHWPLLLCISNTRFFTHLFDVEILGFDSECVCSRFSTKK
jgi:hypothetical protein